MQSALISLLAGRRGHFRLESGFHGEQWYDLDRLLADRATLCPFAVELARRLAAHRPDAVCGPETGGAQLAALIAAELGRPVFRTERFAPPESTALFSVRYTVPAADRAALRGRRLALVDDAISAGSAVRGSLADLLACGAQPVALGALFVFGERAAAFAREHALPLEVIAPMPSSLWPPDRCPLCHAGVPLESLPVSV